MILTDNSTQAYAYKLLREYRSKLTRQQIKTFAGQIKGGNPEAAVKGINRLLSEGRIRA